MLRHPDGRGRRFGDDDGPAVLVDVRRPDALWSMIARRPRIAVGESYVDGHWDCDDLVSLFALLGRNLDTASSSPLMRAAHRLQRVLPDLSERQTLRVAPGNLRAHYDLGNELLPSSCSTPR